MQTKRTAHLDWEQVLERESEAFQARIAAFLQVKRSFVQFGSGRQTRARIAEADLADSAWRAAKAEADRIRQQVCE